MTADQRTQLKRKVSEIQHQRFRKELRFKHPARKQHVGAGRMRVS